MSVAKMAVGVLAALLFVLAGAQMIGTRSISGDTVLEAFIHAVGLCSFGAAALSITVAIPAARTGPRALRCPECGDEYQRGDRTCATCGAKLPSPSGARDRDAAGVR